MLIRYSNRFPASMTGSESKAKPESDVTPAGQENLKLDDYTPIGEDSSYSLIRSGC